MIMDGIELLHETVLNIATDVNDRLTRLEELIKHIASNKTINRRDITDALTAALGAMANVTPADRDQLILPIPNIRNKGSR